MTSSSGLPKYIQVSEMLIREIAAGHLQDGERLPTERDMAANLSISVGTLRKSLADLEDKGLVERIHGSGNYIRAKTDAESVYAFLRLEAIKGGGLPTADIVSVDLLDKPKDAPDFGPHAQAHRIRRLRFLGGIASAVEEIWLDASVSDAIATEDLGDSLYLFYKTQLGVIITRAEDRVGLSSVPEWAPSDFDLPVGDPCPFIERVSWDQNNKRVEYSRTWFDADKARYITRLR